MDILFKLSPHAWPNHWKLAFLLIPWLVLYAGLAITAKLAWSKDLRVMLEALQSSAWLKLKIFSWINCGLWGRFILASMIGALLSWPINQIHIRKGKIDQSEIKKFPPDLRRTLLLGRYLMHCGGLLVLITLLIYKITALR